MFLSLDINYFKKYEKYGMEYQNTKLTRNIFAKCVNPLPVTQWNTLDPYFKKVPKNKF